MTVNTRLSSLAVVADQVTNQESAGTNVKMQAAKSNQVSNQIKSSKADTKSKINFYDKAIDCYVYGDVKLINREWFDLFIQTCDDRIIDVFSDGISLASIPAVLSYRYAGGFGILKIANVFTYEFISEIISDWAFGGIKAKLSLERIEISRPARGSFWINSPARHSLEKLSSALVYHNRVASFKIIGSYQQKSRHGEDGVVHVFEVDGEDKTKINNANDLLFLGMGRFLVRWGGLNRLSKPPLSRNNQNPKTTISSANASLVNQDVISTNANVNESSDGVHCITSEVVDGKRVFINPSWENYIKMSDKQRKYVVQMQKRKGMVPYSSIRPPDENYV